MLEIALGVGVLQSLAAVEQLFAFLNAEVLLGTWGLFDAASDVGRLLRHVLRHVIVLLLAVSFAHLLVIGLLVEEGWVN